MYQCDKWSYGSLDVQTTKPTIVQERVMDNNEFIIYTQTYKPDYRKIFTDGSKSEDSTKAAYFDSFTKTGQCYVLDQHSSVFTAEAYAIFKALKYVQDIENSRRFLIITDSLSVLTSLDNYKISYKDNLYIYLIREILYDMKLYKVIEFMWVPSHAGITGNEVVDRMMKINELDCHLDLSPVPITDYNALINRRMFSNWNRKWAETKMIKGKWYADIQKEIFGKPWYFKLQEPSRRYITTINRIRMGHGQFPAHLHRIKLRSSSNCDYCTAENADLQHIIMECPAFVYLLM
ncbi:uncharacterized protein LOC131846132 [Achroia grisella]|uniref:uncharacterized protein LOC131846132 n=1 Tax=Achroia grisella TaxID=688607 RepID=UPI0027D1F363|nr:uncharacterized protein LOC131846132 [Achroia grisella]